jgi:putative membrane protein
MKKILLATFATILSLAASAQNNLTKKEIKVIKTTSDISMLAVKIADLAPTHAMSADVKAAAQRLSEDYKKVKQDVDALAAKKSISLETTPKMMERGEKIYNYYDKKQGKDFDKAWLKGAYKINKGGICKVKKIYKKTDDPDVKDWAGKLLSTLEMHKTLLKQTCDTVKKSK